MGIVDIISLKAGIESSYSKEMLINSLWKLTKWMAAVSREENWVPEHRGRKQFTTYHFES
jgi:hypothetical protein